LNYPVISYADIAERIGIKKATIHYHFSNKQDLVQAILQKYRKEFMNKLNQIDKLSINAEEKIFRFFQHCRKTLANYLELCYAR